MEKPREHYGIRWTKLVHRFGEMDTVNVSDVQTKGMFFVFFNHGTP